MKATKFIESRYAEECVRRGKFRIAQLRFFQRVEDDGIRDEHEGISVTTIPALTLRNNDPTTVDIRKRFEKFNFIDMNGSGQLIFGGNNRIVFESEPVFILSLSLNPACPKWLDGKDPKDAAVTIRCVRIVGKTIAEKYSSIVGPPRFGRVKYTQRVTDISIEDPTAADPFQKRASFADEEEYRIVFPAKDQTKEEFFSDCPQISEYLSWTLRRP